MLEREIEAMMRAEARKMAEEAVSEIAGFVLLGKDRSDEELKALWSLMSPSSQVLFIAILDKLKEHK